jgi:hypothetical protein
VQARFLALAHRLGDHGEFKSTEHGHWLAAPFESIYELKPSGARFMGFFHEHNFYVTNGAPKRKGKAQNSDYAIAEKMRTDFYSGISQS